MGLPGLRTYRERAFLTQAELAAQAGVSEVTVNRIEGGRHRPRFRTIRKLAEALAVRPEELIRPDHSG